MIRYRLDDLGWYQFEWLVQAVLKNDLGIGVESWGGHGDQGRDAWYEGSLNFPSKQSTSNGPFLFQVKFVENANAAGAKPSTRLLAAVEKEMANAIHHHWASEAPSAGCKHYVLLTNSRITPKVRSTITTLVRRSLRGVEVHSLGGDDVCDRLDANESIRRAFPQLLSLRDLDLLLSGVTNKDILERSSAATLKARDFVPVFVPTGAYARAWDALKKHHFVVLDGPPEMGKSAIAWTIALTQIADGWEASVCDSPDDFFRALRSDSSQIFVADDAFGRTEYDPDRGMKWEAQLERVFSRLGTSHWLVWTSRKHILERARKRIDLQGAVTHFPQPAEVVVDASDLKLLEKALMLYRHSKRALQDAESKSLVRHHALQIVRNLAFTPERIRRFVVEAVPALRKDLAAGTSEALKAKVAEEIQNPTERMRKCFQALPLEHKWMLLSLLESEHYCTAEDLISRFQSQYTGPGAKTQDVLEELREAFVTLKGTTQRYVEWIHPSYRDLVIEQLRDGGSLRSEFLNRMNVAGVKLALSEAGGATGKLKFPLVNSATEWETLQERCLELARKSGSEHCGSLLNVLANAHDSATGQQRASVQGILKATCRTLRERWDAEQAELDSATVGAYTNASERTTPMEPMPALDATWAAVVHRLTEQIEDNDIDFLFDSGALDEFISMFEAIRDSDPRLLRRVHFPSALDPAIEALLARIDRELEADRSYDDDEGYDSEADASFALAKSLGQLDDIVSPLEKLIKPRIDR